MTTPETIDVPATTQPVTEAPRGSMAIERRGEVGVGRTLTVDQLKEKLDFVRNVMKNVMREDQDYGKIPGTGDKPSLLQPGAQKLLMTFNLREQVKRETLREYPDINGVFGHREYEFTITVFPAGARPEDGWDGVGTCSTLESKYRYRKAERKCPECGKTAIIAGKEEYGGGFLCWKKKGGCGAKFHDRHEAIISQSTEDVENEDPADQWNTVRKMGFKRALVSAAINATNTSELWTQDLEDMPQDGAPKPKGSQTSQKPPAATKTPPAAQTPQAKPATQQAPPANKPPPPAQPQFASDVTRAWLIRQLEPRRRVADEFFRKVANPSVLMPMESLESIPYEFLPLNKDQFKLLVAKLDAFEAGGPPEHPFPPNPIKEEEKQRRAAKAKAAEPPKPAAEPPKPAPVKTMTPVDAHGGYNPQGPRNLPESKPKKRDPEWFFDVVCPIPRRGMKKAEYIKHPDTVGTLYKAMKQGDDEAQKRLWGFAKHWEPQPFKTESGKTYPISEADKIFREALDAFCEWEERHGQDTPYNQPAEAEAAQESPGDDDDIPM